MTQFSPPMERQAMGPGAQPAAGNGPASAADELDRLERELRADPCSLVRRACQLADYESIAPGGEPGEPAGR